LRDAESLLDQLASFGTVEITLENVRRVLGSAPDEVIAGIIQAVVGGDVGAGLKWINEALDGGVEARQLTREILDYLRGLLLVKSGSAALLNVTPEMLKEMTRQADSIALGRLLHTARLFNGATNLLKTGIHGQLPLELAFVEAALPEESANLADKGAGSGDRKPPARPAPTPPTRTLSVPPAAEVNPSAGAKATAAAGPAATSVEPPSTSPVAEADSDASAKASAPAGVVADQPEEKQPSLSAEAAASTSAETDAPPNPIRVDVTWLKNNWGQLLQAIRRRSLPVEALLKSCEPVAVQDNVVTLGFYGAWHKERMSEDKNRLIVEEALAEVAGKPYRVKIVLYEGNRQERQRQATADRHDELLRNPVVREAIEQFGAKVVDVE
jgi:DNA polymerase-3 subunit gamma/tau